jgi:beta-glucanase (GH16 family)
VRTSRAATVLLYVILACAGAAVVAHGQAVQGPHHVQPRWTLVWSDEFNGPEGSAPDPGKWTYDLGIGGNGWGNHELEYYTNRPENASIHDGNLVITARRESFSGPADPSPARSAAPGAAGTVTRAYTSARIKTLGLFSGTYGRFEARIRIPYGQGMWPAFWMLGADIDKTQWPSCGEIDIMENIGKEPSSVHGSLHGPGPGGRGTDDMTAVLELPHGERFADAFHVFAVEWEPKVIRFYVDGNLYFTATPQGMPHGTGWAFDHPFFVLLNLAVGGDWPGDPDAGTQFPQQMLVDYVRVYAPARPAAVGPHRPGAGGDDGLHAQSQFPLPVLPHGDPSLLRELR